MAALVIAGSASGVGKTTIATAIMGSLMRRGLKVQPFKAGPDYIDPSYHSRVCGQPSRNLDTWLLSSSAVLELFHRAMAGKDIAVVEGVMGLYDGRSSLSEEGSTAQLVKLLKAPVVLVVDAARAARSLAALVRGYRDFDPGLRLGGVILNGVGSENHYRLCRESIEWATGIPVLGFMPRRPDLALPERHLGLIPTIEGTVADEFFHRLIDQAEATLDIQLLMSLSEGATPPAPALEVFPAQKLPARVGIAVARDKAFSFYYQDSLDLLEAWGGELIPFSPLEDSALPADAAGMYLGGGFPELYARELTENKGLVESIRKAVERGMPIYAECGGLMYLGEAITDLEGCKYPMVGAIPVRTCLNNPRLSLGYRTVTALGDGPLLRQGQTVRGHEFHWSVLASSSAEPNAYHVVEEGRREGFHIGSVLASYVHLHMASLPTIAARFVNCCQQFGRRP